MAAPLSLHHIRPPISQHNPHFRNTTASTSSSAAITTTNAAFTANKAKINYPIQPQPCLALIEKCSDMSQLKQIHAQMLRTGLFFDAFTASQIVAFCALEDSDSLDYARLILNQISNPTIYTCNSIIRGYTKRDRAREVILFYREMIFNGLEPDRFTFPSLFKSCGDLQEGKQLHCHSTKYGVASDSYVQNTLMNMYSSSGYLVSAWKVFEKMDEKTVFSWATMIGAYAQWGQPNEALELFDRMISENVKPNEVALVNVLSACARARDLEMVKQVHHYADKSGFRSHVVRTFEEMKKRE